jgi:CRP-like cAMP-binding protein
MFEQGQIAELLYLVLKGEVTVRYKPEDGPALTLAHVRPEGVVGWSSALGNPFYTSSAVCATDSELLRVRGADLRLYCEQHPETGAIVLERLAALIAERVSNTHHYVINLLRQGLNLPVRLRWSVDHFYLLISQLNIIDQEVNL